MGSSARTPMNCSVPQRFHQNEHNTQLVEKTLGRYSLLAEYIVLSSLIEQNQVGNVQKVDLDAMCRHGINPMTYAGQFHHSGSSPRRC